MANIEINSLHPAGSELFHDSESFLNELSDREMWGVQGGLTLDTVGASLSESLSGISGGTLPPESLSGISGGTLGLTVTPL
jgi:hypothetical protein